VIVFSNRKGSGGIQSIKFPRQQSLLNSLALVVFMKTLLGELEVHLGVGLIEIKYLVRK